MLKKAVGFIANGVLYVLFAKPKMITKKFVASIYSQVVGSNYIVVPITVGDVKFSLLLDLGDRGLTYELLYTGIREREIVEYLVNFLRSDNGIQTIVDIGSNVGFFPILEGIVGKNKLNKIYAIEPVSDNFKLLSTNIALNNLQGLIKPIRCAVGERDVEIEINVTERRNQSRIFDKGPSNIIRKERVPMYRLETLFTKYSIPQEDIMFRFDIEGYEYNMIKGNTDFLKNLHNVYMEFELHNGILGVEKTVELLRLLESLGFEIVTTIAKYPHHIYVLPNFIQKIGEKFIKMRAHPIRFGEIETDISFGELIRRIKNNEYLYIVHLLVKKE